MLLLAFMTLVFLLALRLKDNSIVDVAYGLAFVLVGWSSYLIYGSGHGRQLLMLGLVTLWGLRLAGHIRLRKRGEAGEDFRYRQWRREWGKTFVWRSFLQIFMLQGGVVFVVGLPLMLVISQPGGPLGLLDLLGVGIWLFGFGFETLGDWQLLRFKQNPANKGRIIQSGLWRFTRHPNYFGEATLWWGIWLIALGAPYGAIAILSPLLIDFLLLKVSGIPMLETKYREHPEFAAYRQRTNAFFPWPPKAGNGE
ncbi:steroid 5-alpha reductase [Geoalkalibacter ferrihydriticus DSM 17813]|uniref:Steroid 5-alpha reductase n=1 Tax=Geoalkalibacter ferrihydriticus DSM 17813 TaxID=1121915 RepID=A0A0C2HVD4_9BACT|nr:steroid 5-alpha reductase [Geoalkalibacter ferrihydriticus DSM 17813]